jgi:glycosyltransferase involved in cell wall biosynthesis
MRILITSIVDLKRVPHNRIHVFAHHLSQSHDVTVACMNAWWLENASREDARDEYVSDPLFEDLFEKVELVYLSEGRHSPVLQQLAPLPGLSAFLSGIDFPKYDVHVNYCDLLPGYSVARAGKRMGIPTVFDIADDLPNSFALSPRVPRVLRPLGRYVAEILLKANVRLAARVTVVTQAIRDAYRLPEEKSVLIPNGVHERFFSPTSGLALRKGLGLEGSFVVGFVGTMLEWVDLEPPFAALKELSAQGKDIKMLIVGGGETLQHNMRLAREHGIAERVLFTNQVPLGRVHDYVSCMDVGLICRTETADSDRSLPVKLFEYMACQKPVISVPLSGVEEAVADRVLYARGPDQLVSRISELYGDRDLRHRMGLRGSEFVRERYAWSSICRRFEDILVETANEGSAP